KLEKLYRAFDEKQRAAFAEALKIAKADPQSDTAFAALEWLLKSPRAYHLPVGKPALELMTGHHAANPKVGQAVAILAYYPPAEKDSTYRQAVALLEAVAKKNPDRAARGNA